MFLWIWNGFLFLLFITLSIYRVILKKQTKYTHTKTQKIEYTLQML